MAIFKQCAVFLILVIFYCSSVFLCPSLSLSIFAPKSCDLEYAVLRFSLSLSSLSLRDPKAPPLRNLQPNLQISATSSTPNFCSIQRHFYHAFLKPITFFSKSIHLYFYIFLRKHQRLPPSLDPPNLVISAGLLCTSHTPIL